MSTIAIVWEMGAGLGHIIRLSAIADALYNNGHQLVFILKSPNQLTSISEDAHLRFEVLQAPKSNLKTVKLSRQPANLSELMLANGYNNTDELSHQINEWRSLLTKINPDLIVLDYAPTAALACRGLDFVTLGIDDPFSKPPATHPIPSYTTEQTINKANLEASDKVFVSYVNSALKTLSIKPIEYAHQAWQTHQSLILSYPEFDPYQAHRVDGKYIGQVSPPNNHQSMHWSTPKAFSKIFAYLKPSYPQLSTFLDVISAKEIELNAFIPNANKKLVKQFSSDHIRISTTPYDLPSGLGKANAVVCHTGHSTALNAVINACPTLCIPLQQEQLTTARKCIENGFGVGLGPHSGEQKISAAIDKVLSAECLKENVLAFQQQHKKQSSSALTVILNTIGGML